MVIIRESPLARWPLYRNLPLAIWSLYKNHLQPGGHYTEITFSDTSHYTIKLYRNLPLAIWSLYEKHLQPGDHYTEITFSRVINVQKYLLQQESKVFIPFTRRWGCYTLLSSYSSQSGNWIPPIPHWRDPLCQFSPGSNSSLHEGV